LNEIIEKNRVREIPGVGETIADIVKKLHLTGTHPTRKSAGSLRQTWCRNRDKCQSMAVGFGLAMALTRPGAWVYVPHQS
jgi:hypothetical protein